MDRIVILGCAGTGKTTLARHLGRLTGAPVIYLDEIWQPHWTKEGVPAFRNLIEKLHASDSWISDGNFALATFDLRLPRATLVIWLERSRLYCIWRVILRAFKPGEPHRVGGLPKVFAFIWSFDRVNRPRIEAMRISINSDVPVRRLSGSRDIQELLAEYGRRATEKA